MTTTAEHIRGLIAEAPHAAGDCVDYGALGWEARIIAVRRHRGRFSYDVEVCDPRGVPIVIERGVRDAQLGRTDAVLGVSYFDGDGDGDGDD